jgi:SM-20-related protein
MELIIQYHDFLGNHLNRQLYELAIRKSEFFAASKTSDSKYNPDWRRSRVIFDEQLAGFHRIIESKLLEILPEMFNRLCIDPFRIGSFEVQLTTHNHGDFFKIHRDNGTVNTNTRRITFVYYFHAQPKPFSGGELILYDLERQELITPRNDLLVLFLSHRIHEVKPVSCPDAAFENGRFTLNGWIRSASSATASSFHFGYNMFRPDFNKKSLIKSKH